jgi:hypothetical protein
VCMDLHILDIPLPCRIDVKLQQDTHNLLQFCIRNNISLYLPEIIMYDTYDVVEFCCNFAKFNRNGVILICHILQPFG